MRNEKADKNYTFSSHATDIFTTGYSILLQGISGVWTKQ